MSVLRSAVTAAAGLALSLTSPAMAGGGVSISSYGQRALLIQGAASRCCSTPIRQWVVLRGFLNPG